MQFERSIYIKTFGCQMNLYDSQMMQSLLKERGFGRTEDIRSADVVLLNTCAIRDKAEQKVRSMLGQLKELKEERPKMVLGVTGCVGERLGRRLLEKLPHLDLVLGPDQVDQIGDLVEEVIDGGKRVVATGFEKSGRSYSQPAVVHQAKTTEFLTIIKGCDHYCSYCIVPFTRGKERSRPIAEILEDVRKLVDGGTREVIYLGQNINTYGKGTEENLAGLIEATNEIEGLERIRYITSHPWDLGQDLIEQFGSVEKLQPQLHLPFQSGSDEVLKRMGRLYNRELYLSKVTALRRARPRMALSTDVIVGFPGETESQFQETLSVIEEVEFCSVFAFSYSERPGTRAVQFKDDIPFEVKKDRLNRLLALVNPMGEKENKTRVGTIQKVLLENIDRKGRYYMGRTPDYKITHVYNAGAACLGKVIDVDITETTGSNLKGYYLGAPRVKAAL